MRERDKRCVVVVVQYIKGQANIYYNEFKVAHLIVVEAIVVAYYR